MSIFEILMVKVRYNACIFRLAEIHGADTVDTQTDQLLPMGRTLLQYSLALMLWLFTSLRTRTQMKPTKEQKTMCHRVSVMGNAARHDVLRDRK